MRSISESGILAIFLGGLVLNQTTSRATVLHEAPGRLARCFVSRASGGHPSKEFRHWLSILHLLAPKSVKHEGDNLSPSLNVKYI
jgi:hypothetical protein